MTTPMLSYKDHRYPVEIINHYVWLMISVPAYHARRGVVVSYETIRRWCAKFGQAYTNQVRRRRSRPGDTWHLDEVFIRLNDKLRYLWPTADQQGNVLDVQVHTRRNTFAVKSFRQLLKGLGHMPRAIVTDKLGSYQLTHRELLASAKHRRSEYPQ